MSIKKILSDNVLEMCLINHSDRLSNLEGSLAKLCAAVDGLVMRAREGEQASTEEIADGIRASYLMQPAASRCRADFEASLSKHGWAQDMDVPTLYAHGATGLQIFLRDEHFCLMPYSTSVCYTYNGYNLGKLMNHCGLGDVLEVCK
jgi:hypothetical protein